MSNFDTCRCQENCCVHTMDCNYCKLVGASIPAKPFSEEECQHCVSKTECNVKADAAE